MLTWEEIEIPRCATFAPCVIIRRNGAMVAFEPCKSTLLHTSEVLVFGRLTNVFAALGGLRSHVRQRLGIVNLKQKSSGFFSASKANLRNAP